ncbi:hypothetical protein BDV93DRAFT_521006 [Ceratobasidium sp. AG-I]|nr:hypothetical protein BDV93DRAFT_521006 [Ceratobasidium sp. AG-I]
MPPPPLASNLGPKYHPATPVDSAGPSESSTPPAKRARKAVVTSGGPPGIAQTRSKRKTRAPK